MTILTALAFSILLMLQKKTNAVSKSTVTATLMFWAAAIMWSVDGIASVLEGESFFDISMEDTILGLIIVAAGLAVFAVLKMIEAKKSKSAAA